MQFSSLAETLGHDPFISLLAGIVLLLTVLTIWLSWRLNTLVKGKDGTSLEDIIRAMSAKVEKLENQVKETGATLKSHDRRIARAIQGVSVKRFDPFQNAGGQQSFATSLVNEQGDGIVMSGIHARDGVRVYAKPVKGFSSERELSEEERDSIEEARKKL